MLDGADLTDVAKRIAVTPDLPSRMQIDGEPLDLASVLRWRRRMPHKFCSGAKPAMVRSSGPMPPMRTWRERLEVLMG